MELDFRVRGDGKLIRTFEKLGNVGKDVVLAEAATAASEPIINAAKGNAPNAVISEGIRLVALEITQRGKVTAKIGLPGGKKPWFKGLFIELGTGPRIQKKTGRRTGSMPAAPFLRPAFDSEKERAQALFANHIRTRLAQVAADGGL